jgi:hypothetical protein
MRYQIPKSFLFTLGNILGLTGLSCLLFAEDGFASGRFNIGPFASVSSTKGIKPSADKESSEEVTTQRTTYGVKVGLGLGRLFNLDIKAGVNEVDRTKKAAAMRDEFGDIDFEKDANVDPAAQDATYRYKESQKLGTARLLISPRLFSMVWMDVGAGVRVRKRDVTVSDDAAGTKQVIDDPIRYHAIGSAGVRFRLLRSFTGNVEYSFYFLNFPEIEPHEQEVAIGFGVSI